MAPADNPLGGYSADSVKNALQMAFAAIESKQKAIDKLQNEIEDYRKQLEHYIAIDREAQELAYGSVVDPLPLEQKDAPGLVSHAREPHDKSIVVILQETLNELNTCKSTIQEQEDRLAILDVLTKRSSSSHAGKENRISDGGSCTNALYEKLLKEKDDTISELALLLASREQSLRDVFANAIISSLPSSPRSDQ